MTALDRSTTVRTLLFTLSLLPFIQSAMAASPDAPAPGAKFLPDAKVWLYQDKELQRVWYANGLLKAEGGMADSHKEGNWKYYFETGKLKGEGSYSHDQKSGNWKLYHTNGKLKAEGAYQNNLREGEWVFYFENGNREMSGPFVNGKRHGTWKHYYETGALFSEGEYDKGVSHGKWVFYFKNGKLYQKGSYQSEMRIGEWTICIDPETPCQTQTFVPSRVPSRAGLPSDAPGSTGASDPGKILESLDKGGVPDTVPPSLQQNGWE